MSMSDDPKRVPGEEHSSIAADPGRRLHRDLRDFTFPQIVRLATGKARRWFQGHFRAKWVARQTDIRKGECARCGACCKLLFRCPFLLEEVPGLYTCKIHGNKPENCHIFPINKADLRDRNMVMPSQKCGYHFD